FPQYPRKRNFCARDAAQVQCKVYAVDYVTISYEEVTSYLQKHFAQGHCHLSSSGCQQELDRSVVEPWGKSQASVFGILQVLSLPGDFSFFTRGIEAADEITSRAEPDAQGFFLNVPD